MVDYHISGIAGVGMSALAQFLLDRGHTLSGSDRRWDRGDRPPVLHRLRAQGVRLYPQDGRAVEQAATLVISSAIEKDNPEVVRAATLGRPVRHRARVLADPLASSTLVAVTGTSGKSTTTALLGTLLEGAGFDPTVINGAAVIDWDAPGRVASVRKGRGDICVAELDESDRSLLLFAPDHAIITNASADHFSLPETLRLFAEFRKRVPGKMIDGAGAPAAELPDGDPDGWEQRFFHAGRRWKLPLPGRHNRSNAVQALDMAMHLGADPEALARRLAAFRGVERRLQRLFSRGGVQVVDDYAHNPAKLKAAWLTTAGTSERIVGLWRPHGFGPLRAMFAPLAELFPAILRPGDLLLVAPVYDAGGSADRSLNSDRLVERIVRHGGPCRFVPDLGEAESVMLREASPGTTLLTLGARDPGIPELARRLAGRLAAENRRHTIPRDRRRPRQA